VPPNNHWFGPYSCLVNRTPYEPISYNFNSSLLFLSRSGCYGKSTSKEGDYQVKKRDFRFTNYDFRFEILDSSAFTEASTFADVTARQDDEAGDTGCWILVDPHEIKIHYPTG